MGNSDVSSGAIDGYVFNSTSAVEKTSIPRSIVYWTNSESFCVQNLVNFIRKYIFFALQTLYKLSSITIFAQSVPARCEQSSITFAGLRLPQAVENFIGLKA